VDLHSDDRPLALDLFSGGLAACSEALAPVFRTGAYCEVDELRGGMLLSRMYRGEIDLAPVWSDVATLRAARLPFRPAIVYGTFPCKGISLAGPRDLLANKQSALFWHIVRIAEETKAPLIFLENNWPGIRPLVGAIRDAFEGLGYECRDGHLSARDVGARHIRERWFLLAHSARFSRDLRQAEGEDVPRSKDPLGDREAPDGDGSELRVERRRKGRKKGEGPQEPPGALGGVRDTDADRAREPLGWASLGLGTELSERFDLLEGHDWDSHAANLLRVGSGLPHKGKRIAALGDSNPPALYREAFRRLLGA
jgi:DNA (cytosine-5)-methyltransferase 1